MSLDIKQIINAEDEQERMVMVWQLIAESLNGIPGRVIFYVDNRLDISGWKWAPRSLLSSGPDPSMDAMLKVSRFAEVAGSEKHWGGIHELGLRVQFPGFMLEAKPRAPGMSLHPWRDLKKQYEDRLLLQNPGDKKWYSLCDEYRGFKLASWSNEERIQYDEAADSPLCRATHERGCAVIRDPLSTHAVMVQSSEDVNLCSTLEQAARPTHARIQRRVMVFELNPSQQLVAETLTKIADRLTEEICQGILPRTSGERGDR
jgi:hypothetical protein